MEGTTTSWFVVGVGVVVAVLGYLMLPGQFAGGVFGFGLAHIVLGLLDLARPTVQE